MTDPVRKIGTLLGAFFLVVLVLLGGSVPTQAASRAGFTLGVEPIVGFERVQKFVPTPHTKNRLLYGARLTAGVLLISAEAEYTRGTDDESFPDQDLSIRETSDKAKLGIRSGFQLGQLILFNLRAGGQASKSRREETHAGVTSTFSEEPKIKPYAGAGLRGHLSNKISASAEVVAVFNDLNDLGKNEYQTTAGFSVQFP